MSKIIEQLIKLIIKNRINSPDSLSVLKRSFAKKHGLTPTNIILLKAFYSMTKKGEIRLSESRKKEIESLLRVRRVRSQSGVAVVAVLTKDFGCPGKCLYCPTEKGMPKSYLSNEPAVMRAILNEFDPFRQMKMRLQALENSGHPTDKVELIIIGGTFSAIPDKYRYEFIKRCFEAANSNSKLKKINAKRNAKGGNLKAVQKLNEKSKHRIVGLTIETRPDYINKKEILKLRELGVTRVELGVQSIYDDVLTLNRRDHDIAQTISATKLLKDAGFKINYHMMPNLPGSNIDRDKKMFRELFSNENFQPDILKIYPTVVMENSDLYELWKRGEYKPYTDKELLELLIEIKKNIPPYVRIMRLIRDIPSQSISAGSKISNLRQIIEQHSKKSGPPNGEASWHCRCIRCREVGKTESGKEKMKSKSLRLIRRDYGASGGKEIFLSFEDTKNDKLLALLRLRIPSSRNHFIPALDGAAIIREVHTYGQTVPIAKKTKGASQHIGLGKQLIFEAERIVREEFMTKSARGGSAFGRIAVISGVGVRDYYRKLGYKLKDEYMVKSLD